MIKINGNYLEGGGQIIRTALALSALTGKPFEADKIRQGRKKPGLKAQHLNCITALEQLCNAKVEGGELGYDKITFNPGKLNLKNITIDIGTAGSIPLLLQSLLPVLIFGDRRSILKILGGTDGLWAPPVDYLRNILVPHLKKYADIELTIERRGYYPKGGGEVEITVNPKYKIKDFKDFTNMQDFLKKKAGEISLIERGELASIKGISHCSKSLEDSRVADRQAKAAEFALKDLKMPVEIRAEYREAYSTGSGITLWAIFLDKQGEINFGNPVILGGSCLGERGKKSETVGKEAAEILKKEINSGAAIDSHLCDQILPFMAITGKGQIKTSKITDHAKTNIYTIEKFLGKCFDIIGDQIKIKPEN